MGGASSGLSSAPGMAGAMSGPAYSGTGAPATTAAYTSGSPSASPGSPASVPSASASSAPGSTGSGSSGSGMGSMGSTPGASCTNEIVVNAMLDPFIQHFYRAHLQRSPGQQVNDILNPNQYVLTHTVLLEDMIAPGIAAGQDSLNGIVPFTNHFYKAHLSRSPGDQVNDILNTNQYVTTHTVLIEDMAAPAVESAEGTYGC